MERPAPRARKRRRTALFDKPVPADEVVLHVLRLADVITTGLSVLFAEYGLTMQQFNALRILYVQDPAAQGFPSGAIGSRLVSRVPDVTRLFDRLVNNGLVERFRSETDRRVVLVRLTPKGIDVVERVHEPLLDHNRKLLAHRSDAQLARLSRALEQTLAGLR